MNRIEEYIRKAVEDYFAQRREENESECPPMTEEGNLFRKLLYIIFLWD